MPVQRLLVALVVGLALGGCGGAGSAPKDDRVAKGVKGSGQDQLLADQTFRNAVEAIGVSAGVQPPSRLGARIGTRLRAITTDAGRLAPRSFRPGAYRRRLLALGPLSEAELRRRYGAGPLELADRIGALVGQLDVGLDEGARPAPDLATGVMTGFGLDGAKAHPAGAILAVRDELSSLLPDAPDLPAATHFRSSYVFVATVLR